MGTPSGTLTSTGLKTPMHNIILGLARSTMINRNVRYDLQVIKLCITIIKRTRAYYRHFTCRLPRSILLKLRLGIKAGG